MILVRGIIDNVLDFCWVVIVNCDKIVDGWFVYVVKIIGVYCWFLCLFCQVKVENIEFYVDNDVVEFVGYWLCKCC